MNALQNTSNKRKGVQKENSVSSERLLMVHKHNILHIVFYLNKQNLLNTAV